MKNVVQRKVFWFSSLCVGLLICMSNQLQAHPLPEGVTNAQFLQSLKDTWAEVKYQKEGKEQLEAFEDLSLESEHFVIERPEFAEAYLWHGTILASYAKVKGGVGAIKLIKSAKKNLEKSIAMKQDAEGGLGHAVLGSLYARAPGWPVAFGDKKKAGNHLRKALDITPESRDANYYYGDYLVGIGRVKEGKVYLNKALKTKSHKVSKTFNQGREAEIKQSLSKVQHL